MAGSYEANRERRSNSAKGEAGGITACLGTAAAMAVAAVDMTAVSQQIVAGGPKLELRSEWAGKCEQSAVFVILYFRTRRPNYRPLLLLLQLKGRMVQTYVEE